MKSSSSSSSSASCQCIAATWDFGMIAVKHGIELMLCNNNTDNNNDNSSDNGNQRKDNNDNVIPCYYKAIDIVEKSINIVELDTHDQYYVGYGGLPNANGIMELDAAIMDHNSKYGAVMCLQNIKIPISVARRILEKCPHNILCGEGALEWAIKESFHIDYDILTEKSKNEWIQWKQSLLSNNNNNDIDGNAIMSISS